MIDMTRVWERLYIGSRDDAEGLYMSNPSGITTVVTLCEKGALLRNPNVNYLHVPIVDAAPLGVGQFEAFINAVAGSICGGTVLLHCGAGVSRAPIMAALWMHCCGYKSIDASLEEIARLRPTIAPSGILLASVKEHLQ
jgi:protein-tyrosine phosphatase